MIRGVGPRKAFSTSSDVASSFSVTEQTKSRVKLRKKYSYHCAQVECKESINWTWINAITQSFFNENALAPRTRKVKETEKKTLVIQAFYLFLCSLTKSTLHSSEWAGWKLANIWKYQKQWGTVWICSPAWAMILWKFQIYRERNRRKFTINHLLLSACKFKHRCEATIFNTRKKMKNTSRKSIQLMAWHLH